MTQLESTRSCSLQIDNARRHTDLGKHGSKYNLVGEIDTDQGEIDMQLSSRA